MTVIEDAPLVAGSIYMFAKMDRLYINMAKAAKSNMTEGQRKGQAWFNALIDHEPDLAGIIAGTEEDPYHDDEKLPAFMKAIFGRAEVSY